MELKILAFKAPWCQPCRVMSPILDEIEKEFGLDIKKINIDEDVDIMEDYNIRSIPTLVFIKDGREVGRHTGSISKINLINKLASFYEHSK